jgi:hypothetical protein
VFIRDLKFCSADPPMDSSGNTLPFKNEVYQIVAFAIEKDLPANDANGHEWKNKNAKWFFLA